MKKIASYLLSLAFVANTEVFAQDQSKPEVPPMMYEFLSEIAELQPYIYSQESFTSPQNQKFVGDRLQEFAKTSEQLKKHDRLKTPGFEVPASIIVKQLYDLNEAFQAGHKDYAWRSLRSTLHSCSQCHTQISQIRPAPQWEFEDASLPKDPLELADFWFMIRSYDKAFNQYKKVIHEFGKKNSDQFRLRRALRSILTICLRIDRSPTRALEFLNGMSSQRNLPEYLKNDLKTWKNELAALQTLPPMDTAKIPAREMEKLAEDLFRSVYPIPREGRSKEVAMEYGSGLLFDFANKRPKEVSQRMYYWLGTSTIELNRFDFRSFGDQYLKECIERFPPSPISEECLITLKDNWIFGYSGSAGTFLPSTLKEEMKRLEKIIQKK